MCPELTFGKYIATAVRDAAADSRRIRHADRNYTDYTGQRGSRIPEAIIVDLDDDFVNLDDMEDN